MSQQSSPGGRTSLLFVNQHYWPDVASTGQHLTDLAEHLARRGYDVEVLTGRAHYAGGEVEAPPSEERNGVRISRVGGSRFGRARHLGRLADYATSTVRMAYRLFAGRRRDGVVYLTTPPLLPVLGFIARRLRGQRYGVWSMDLHPEAEIAAGMLSPSRLPARLLMWLTGRGYRDADFVVDLGAYMKDRLAAKGVDQGRMHTVHVWSDGGEIVPTPPAQNPLVDDLALRGRFVVMYSGNAGVVHEFDSILEAMLRLRNDPRIYFLFVGGGPRRKDIESFVARHDIRNFSYRGYFPREQLVHSLSLADVHLLSLRAPFVGISVPGKLYGIMAAGRAALFVGPERCETADAIRDGRCGVVVDPAAERDAAGRLVDIIRAWSDVPIVARELGEQGRRVFLERYDRRANCTSFEEVVRRAWGSAGSDIPIPPDPPRVRRPAARATAPRQ